MRRGAVGAIAAQGMQALASFVLQILVARTLGLEGLGVFAILYGVVVLASGVLTGFVGDSLVVLDRRDRAIRSALQQYALGLAVVVAAISALVAWLSGLISPLEALLFAGVIVAFCLEEIVRRTLMAEVLFWRVTAVDFVGLAGALAVIGVAALTVPITLATYLTALLIGQTLALLVGALVVHRDDRFLVRFQRGGYRAVAAYGVWRSLQQFLRPALLTGVRSLVTAFAGLAATGLLEAARIYVAPALLIISGLSSFLFVSFAKDKKSPVAKLVRRADKAVAVLLAGTVGIGVIAVLALPYVGPLLFEATPDLPAVLGWLVYAASVAAVTPYGALAAVGGKQAVVFGIRVGDTVVSLAAVTIALLLGMATPLVALVLAGGSLLGGIVIRVAVLRPLARRAD